MLASLIFLLKYGFCGSFFADSIWILSKTTLERHFSVNENELKMNINTKIK